MVEKPSVADYLVDTGFEYCNMSICFLHLIENSFINTISVRVNLDTFNIAFLGPVITDYLYEELST